MIFAGTGLPSLGQCVIPICVWCSGTSAHSSVTELKRISWFVVYSKNWKWKTYEKKVKKKYFDIIKILYNRGYQIGRTKES